MNRIPEQVAVSDVTAEKAVRTMADTDLLPAPTCRPRRRFRRLIGAAALVGVLAVFVVPMVWAARPRWYTFVSSPKTMSPAFSLVLRVPMGWECRDNQVIDGSGSIGVQIQRKPLTGIARWWSEHVLHLDTTRQPAETYTIGLIAVPIVSLAVDPNFGKGLTQWKQSCQSEMSWFANLGYKTTFRTIRHPIGPAFEMTAVFAAPTALQRRSRPPYPYRWLEDTSVIVKPHPPHVFMLIYTRHTDPSANRFYVTWNQIVSSIRVIQK